ncbi:phage major capsid protein [Hoeflea sp. G2-23]|uniref:Phage major capsid protein n=1 Tax=Hoeflea algicola TaxID=2983763 RepID=A0ABT3Z972_9HYPH|nr:phage major capsid protein [Hoeflea algicola]MCY0148313.1 phage major capsid protein [Hoeflea algicola]
MAFTADEIADINNMALETNLNKGTIFKQDVANKPMLAAFQASAGQFPGGKENVSFLVGSGYGGGTLSGYTGDDQLSHYNPTGSVRFRMPWKEHYLGMQVTMTELKNDGIDVVESGSDQRTREMSGREVQALANILDEKHERMGADYNFSLDRLVHGDGSSDVKALAGIQAFILDNPFIGSTGGISRVANTWWRNDAMTASANGSGGLNKITSSKDNGGALIAALDIAARRRSKFATGQTKTRYFAGSEFIDAYKSELRANGSYTQTGWRGASPDGSMGNPSHGGLNLEWDPTMDDTSRSKFCYAIDMGKRGLRLMYMDGQKYKKHNPARPYDRMVMYNGVSMTGLMVARQLNTSGVYEIN